MTPSDRSLVADYLIPSNDGALLVEIPPQAHPVSVLRIQGTTFPLSLRMGEGAQAVVVLTLDAAQFEGEYVIDVNLQSAAHLTLMTLIHGAARSLNVHQRGVLGDGAQLHWQNATLAVGNISHALESKCMGAHAESSVDWLFYASQSDRLKLHAKNIFSARDGSGTMLMRGIAEDTAYAKCWGMIEIGEGGGGTNTYLTQDVLMLDASAKVDAIPGLEIKTNDVKASHSATVSKVNAEDLFYVGSRGIAKEAARALCIRGFLEDIANRFSDEEMRSAIVNEIEQKQLL